LVNFKLRDPPIPAVQWFQDGKNAIKNNLVIVRSTKSQILSNPNRKVLSLKAKLDSPSFKQNQFRYKQLDKNPFFKVNELNGDLIYTDDLINGNGRTNDMNVLVQPVYINENVQPKQIYYLPQIVCVNFILQGENKNAPKFIVPSNNHTMVIFNLNDGNGNFSKTNGEIFSFVALNEDDLIANDNFEYKLIDSSILKNTTDPDFFEDDDQITRSERMIFF